MIVVEAPDGTEVEFPDGTSPDVMRQAMQRRFGGPSSAPSAAPADAEAPTGRPAMQAAFPGIMARAGLGALKGAGSTLAGVANLAAGGPAGINMSAMPGVDTIFEKAQKALKPTDRDEKLGFTAEQLAEFFIPGAAGMKVPGAAKLGRILGPGLQAGGETAIVDTMQRGHADPGAIAAGTALGAAGAATGRVVGGVGKYLQQKAVERFSQIAPAKGQRAQEAANAAITDMLEKGEARRGGIKTLEAVQKGRVDERMGRVAASRAANADVPIDVPAIMQDLRDQLMKRTSKVPEPRVTELLDDVVDESGGLEAAMSGARKKYDPIRKGAAAPVEDAFAGAPGGPKLTPRELERAVAASERASAASEATSLMDSPGSVVHDEAFKKQLRPFMAKLAEMRRRGTTSAESLEKQRDAWSTVYGKDAPERATGLAGTEKKVHDTIIRHLDEAIPGRQAINKDFSTNKALQDALTRGRINQGTKGTTNPGEAGGMRAMIATALKMAGVGAATGMNPAAMIATPLVEGALRSPLGRSAGAVAEYGAGRAMRAVSPETLRQAGQALGTEIGDRDEEPAAPSMRRETVEKEIIALLEQGDKAAARQRALQYKRATGDRIDTRELELAVSGGER